MQRASIHSRVSVLSRINSGDPDAGSPYPALFPTAYLHLDDTRPHVTPVPGSEVIVWPDNTVFPPDIPSVIALNRPTGEINPGIRPDGNDDSRYAVSSFAPVCHTVRPLIFGAR